MLHIAVNDGKIGGEWEKKKVWAGFGWKNILTFFMCAGIIYFW